jgi:hypothetical protein
MTASTTIRTVFDGIGRQRWIAQGLNAQGIGMKAPAAARRTGTSIAD